MVACPKPGPHKGPGERYDEARQRFIAWRAGNPAGEGVHEAMLPCECRGRNPDESVIPCPCGMKVVVERSVGGRWYTAGQYNTRPGEVDHRELRSREPGLREEFSNLFLLSKFCHDAKDHDALRVKRVAAGGGR